MKKLLDFKWFVVVFFFFQVVGFAQEGKIKIYESNSGDGSSLIVFPSDPEPLMVVTGKGACTVVKTMAVDDWHEMASNTVVTTSVSEAPPEGSSIVSPRDASSGMASGKRQHKPMLLSDLSLGTASDVDMIYSFSWGMSNSGSSAMSSGATGKATYDVKSSNKARTMAPAASSSSCCSNGVCSVTVSVSKKHTKSGHVTLMK